MSSLTLVQLLEQDQPFSELERLDDEDLDSLHTNSEILSRIQGSLIGLAVGDALGAHVEFRPKTYLDDHPVSDMQGGGTWGLPVGHWTDDTSMALCLAASLIVRTGFNGYDQLERYQRWFRNGYMSSTGNCFDIGVSTRDAIQEFEKRCEQEKKKLPSSTTKKGLKYKLEKKVNVDCGAADAAGNGPLMRLAPIPLFYYQSKTDAIRYAGDSAKLTHGDQKAIDACRFYSALIWNAIQGVSKEELLKSDFFTRHFSEPLHDDVMDIVNGSYRNKPNGYADGIRGKGYIINALEAALWAFAYDDNSFEKGVLQAINLGDDTDTTAAIYGQLAGAVYGLSKISQRWQNQLFQRQFILTLANGLYLRGRSVNSSLKRAHDDETIVPTKRRPHVFTESS